MYRPQLDSRERTVLMLLGAGLTAKEVAARLTLKPRTAEGIIEVIHNKFGVDKTITAVILAILEGHLTAEEISHYIYGATR